MGACGVSIMADSSNDSASLPDPNRKYVLVMGAGFFGIFMAFNTAQALQSTVNQTLGNACLCTLYTVFTIACLAGPIVVDKWGPRISMIVGAVTYVAMVLSNLKPSWGLSIPMYFLVGMGAPLLWTGQAVYLSRCANKSAGLELAALQEKGENPNILELVKAKQELYNGYFFSFFQANGCLGLLMASIIQLYTSSIKFLFVILSIICSIGVAIICFGIPNMDNVNLQELVQDASSTSDEANKKEETTQDQPSEASFVMQLWETFRFGITTQRVYMYIPMMLYNGMSLGFFLSDYSRYFIDQSIGNKRAGFVISFFYGSNLLATMLAGKALVRRSVLILGAACLHLGFLFMILFCRASIVDSHGPVLANGAEHPTRWYLDKNKDWQNLNDESAPAATWVIVFGLALVFACGDAVWESQIPAILGGYFPEGKQNSLQAANYKMWQSFGFAAMFGIDVVFPSLTSGDENTDFPHVNDLFFIKVRPGGFVECSSACFAGVYSFVWTCAFCGLHLVHPQVCS